MVPVVALVAALLAQQPTQVVTPTWVNTQDRVCCEVQGQSPCPAESTCPAKQTVALPCPDQQPHCGLHSEMRSKPFFWTGLGVLAGGVTLMVGATSWARDSDGPGLPCGTDPVLARGQMIAGCRASHALLATGAALAGGGAALMFYGGQHVLVGADGRRVTITVKF